jgi:hypothetical protein
MENGSLVVLAAVLETQKGALKICGGAPAITYAFCDEHKEPAVCFYAFTVISSIFKMKKHALPVRAKEPAVFTDTKLTMDPDTADTVFHGAAGKQHRAAPSSFNPGTLWRQAEVITRGTAGHGGVATPGGLPVKLIGRTFNKRGHV